MRAFVVAAAASVLGAALVVGGQLASKNVALTIIGAVLLLFGLLLVALAWFSSRTNIVRVTLDEDGYHVLGPRADRAGRWSEVTKVGVSDDSSHLVISHGEVERVHIWSPLGGDDPQMQGLQAEIVERLDSNRGYTHFS